MNAVHYRHLLRHTGGSVGLEMAIALPIVLSLLMAAIDLSRAAIAQSLFQSAAIAEINIYRSYSSNGLQDLTAAQIQNAVLDRLTVDAGMWIDLASVDVQFLGISDPMGQPVLFSYVAGANSPFHKILVWRQTLGQPFTLYIQKGV